MQKMIFLKTSVFSLAFLLVLSSFLSSCNKEDIDISNITESDTVLNSMQEYPDQYEKLGIKAIEKNITTPFKIPNHMLIPDNKEQFSLTIADYQYTGYNGRESFLFKSSETDNNFYVAAEHEGQLTVLFVEVKPNTISITSWDREVKVNYELADDGQIIKMNNEYLSDLRNSDCDELGPREGGESFGDCFRRNWSNFCCDFVGCVAQITNPYAVSGGIAIACAVE